MTEIVLVKPPLSAEMLYGEMSGIGAYEAPLGLAYLAATLIEHDIPVEIVDGTVSKIPLPQLVEGILEKKPAFVGISAVSLEIHSAARIASLIKEKGRNA